MEILNKLNSSSRAARGLSSPETETAAQGTAETEIPAWAFFLPDRRITDTIWFLSEKIADECEKERDATLFSNDDPFSGIPDVTEEEIQRFKRAFGKNSWYSKWLNKLLFNKLLKVLAHNDPGPEMTDEEYSDFYQRYVAEKVYDHFAMLSRSRAARKDRKEFSLLKEFTVRLAPDLGLGLYIEKETSEEIMILCYRALYDLAANFESWFTEEMGGTFEATFGDVYSLAYFVNHRVEVPSDESVLILEADVSQENKIENDAARKRRYPPASMRRSA